MVFLISANAFPDCNLHTKLTPANVFRASRLKSFFQSSSLNYKRIAQNLRRACWWLIFLARFLTNDIILIYLGWITIGYDTNDCVLCTYSIAVCYLSDTKTVFITLTMHRRVFLVAISLLKLTQYSLDFCKCNL